MNLGERIKGYEEVFDTIMPSRLPVIVRCDGKGFSKFTKKMKLDKPFDIKFIDIMGKSMFETAKDIEGCVFGYTQSDEVTFVLKNDQSLESEPWFGNRTQKITSIVSSIMTANFNKYLKIFFPENDNLAFFDTRVFVVPNWQEAENTLIWRQNDCVKNSIYSACYYEVAKVFGKKTTRKMMYKLNQNQQQELLFQNTKINWNDYPLFFKRGVGCYRVEEEINKVVRNKWKIDQDLPIFTRNKKFLKGIFKTDEESFYCITKDGACIAS